MKILEMVKCNILDMSHDEVSFSEISEKIKELRKEKGIFVSPRNYMPCFIKPRRSDIPNVPRFPKENT